ncbi:MAG: hypothetical protein WC052_04280 [Patescibacteria group bacterium]|jgi:hypothetical protein
MFTDNQRFLEGEIPMAEKSETKQPMGFVCPGWAKPHWNALECTIEECTDGSHVVLDHSLNGVTIYAGATRKDCSDWLNPYC